MLFKMRIVILAAMLTFFIAPVSADINWQFDLKGGAFMSNLDSWSDYYGSQFTYTGAMSFSLQFFKFVEAGGDLVYLRDTGSGQYASSGQSGGDVSYELMPLNVYLGVQGKFSDKPWIVPYIGGSYGRSFYRQQIDFQDDVKGAANGYSIKAGAKLLLDKLDKSSSKMLKENFGVEHSYWIVEYQQLFLEIDSVDLGGKFLFSGIAFSF